jgi:hypothetical protein
VPGDDDDAVAERAQGNGEQLAVRRERPVVGRADITRGREQIPCEKKLS